MDERSKSEKEEMLDKKIEEVRKRNEARMKKFQEAEEDRKRAEEAGCAVILKKSSVYDEGMSQYRHQRPRGTPKTHQHNKSESRPKKYVPATSDEWKEYIEEKNKRSFERADNEENINNNNSNNYNNNSKRERAPKTSDRAIYTPKMMDNRESPENVKPPPPDPRNSFLADSYRSRSIKARQEEAKQTVEAKTPPQINNIVTISTKPGSDEVDDKPAGQRRQAPVPTSLGNHDSMFSGDARQRINQLKALKDQQQQPLPLESARDRITPRPEQQHPHQRKNYLNNFRHTKHGHLLNHKMVREKETTDKPLKSILKKVKTPSDDYDDSHPVIAVITTPGDEGCDEGVQGYNKKKEEAICDWLTKSDFANDSEDEWEDVEEGGSSSSYQQEEAAASETAQHEAQITITTRGEIDDELEAFEEDNAAFQQFIKQHTLTLDGECSGFNWASGMGRLSLEKGYKKSETHSTSEATDPN